MLGGKRSPGFPSLDPSAVFRVPGVELVDARETIENSGKRQSLLPGGWRARRATKVKAKRTEKKSGSAANSTRLDSTRLDGGGGENVPEVEVAALGLASHLAAGDLGSFSLSLSLSLSLFLSG